MLKVIMILCILITLSGCYKQESYLCECEVKECFFCLKYTDVITIYSIDESSASNECDEHGDELYERINRWGSVDCNLN